MTLTAEMYENIYKEEKNLLIELETLMTNFLKEFDTVTAPLQAGNTVASQFVNRLRSNIFNSMGFDFSSVKAQYGIVDPNSIIPTAPIQN